MFENPRRGRQARNFTTNASKMLHLKSSFEQIFSENCRWVPLTFESSILLTRLPKLRVEAFADKQFQTAFRPFQNNENRQQLVFDLLSENQRQRKWNE